MTPNRPPQHREQVFDLEYKNGHQENAQLKLQLEEKAKKEKHLQGTVLELSKEVSRAKGFAESSKMQRTAWMHIAKATVTESMSGKASTDEVGRHKRDAAELGYVHFLDQLLVSAYLHLGQI